MRRYWIMSLLVLWVCGPGCSSMTRRADGTLGFRPGASSDSPVPPQTQVLLPPEPSIDAASTASADPDRGSHGLSRYFPSLKKATVEPVALASTSRPPSWFGLRKGRSSQIYTTDARVQLGKGASEPTMLPVALQIPTADRAVTTTSADVVTPSPSSPTSATDLPKPADPASDKPADPASDKPPEAAASTAAPILDVVAPRVAVADVTPPAAPGPEASESTQAVAGVPAQPQQPPVDPRERPRLASPTGPPPAPPEVKPDATVPAAPDEKTVQANTPIDPTKPLTLPAPTLPASYFTQTSASSSSQAGSPKPTGHVHASAQVAPSSQSATPAGHAKKWKRPCFRRLVRRVGKLGEFANPPTAAPH